MLNATFGTWIFDWIIFGFFWQSINFRRPPRFEFLLCWHWTAALVWRSGCHWKWKYWKDKRLRGGIFHGGWNFFIPIFSTSCYSKSVRHMWTAAFSLFGYCFLTLPNWHIAYSKQIFQQPLARVVCGIECGRSLEKGERNNAIRFWEKFLLGLLTTLTPTKRWKHEAFH